jgi:protoporphyrinogen/coproporphyrinogen III oxidase
VNGRVAVVGGGIAGLATAYRLTRIGVPDVLVLEASDSPGGKIRSEIVGGIELEAGPDSLLVRKPWAVELCREVGLGDELLAPTAAPASVYTNAGLLRFPSGPFGISTDPVELWRWKGMSYLGKMRAAEDLVLPARREDEDESLGSLLRRRIGDEATEKLVAPLLGGLFAGDVDRLSVRATFPELAAWEREHGSLMLGARAAARARRPTGAAGHGSGGSGGPPPMFLRLLGGFHRLTDVLASALGPGGVRLGARVDRIESDGTGYLVHVTDDEVRCDAVVLATPAFVTADLLEDLAPAAVGGLRAIPYVSTAVVLMVYEEGTNHDLPESSGFVAPRGKLAITAATLVSRKWPDPSFGDRAVVRCFLGAAGMQEQIEVDDADLVERAAEQLADVFPLPLEPESHVVVRWPRAMPQYEVGHLERVEAIERALPSGAFVVGQAYRGTGIPDCVRQANEVAGRVRARLAGEAGAER